MGLGGDMGRDARRDRTTRNASFQSRVVMGTRERTAVGIEFPHFAFSLESDGSKTMHPKPPCHTCPYTRTDP